MADAIKADCRKTFYPASRWTYSRPVEEIWWIVEHVGEADTAAGIARWFHKPELPKDGGPAGSTHLAVGTLACYRSLPNTAVPWGAKGANRHGFHIEHEGYAKWSRAKWLKDGKTTLQRGAFKTAYHCHRFGIPAVFRHADELKLNRKGITTHHECVIAFGGDHTCPGPNWPRDEYMRMVMAYYKALDGV